MIAETDLRWFTWERELLMIVDGTSQLLMAEKGWKRSQQWQTRPWLLYHRQQQNALNKAHTADCIAHTVLLLGQWMRWSLPKIMEERASMVMELAGATRRKKSARTRGSAGRRRRKIAFSLLGLL